MAQATWSIRMEGFASFRKRLNLLGEKDTPHLRSAMTKTATLLAGEIRSRGGPYGRTVIVNEPKGQGAALRLRVAVTHPGAKVREFGRTKWYRSPTPGTKAGIGNNRPGSRRRRGSLKRGVAYNRRSIPPRPFVGIKEGSGGAIGAVAPKARDLIGEAMEKTWQDILAGITP